MKTGLRHILCVICLTLATFGLKGQTKPDFDAALNQYELMCGDCIGLRSKVNAGEKVSRQQAKDMLDAFVAMNGDIKAAESSMNIIQKSRFEAINRWFTSGERPAMLDHRHLANVAWTLPAAKAEVMDAAALTWPCSGIPVIQTEPNRHRPRFTVLASASFPDASFGVMAGIQAYSKKKDIPAWGGYINFKSNFIFPQEPTYLCSGNGMLENGGSFWPGGQSQKSTLKVTGGLLVGLGRWLSIYGGAGYGYSRLLWEDVDGEWALVQDCSPAGFASEAGLLFSWRHMTLGAGVSTICFRTASLDLSIGLSF